MTRRANQFGLICYPPPGQLLERATLRGNERTWPIGDIPEVIEVAKENDLASVGGQLQLRFPDGGTCECGESAVQFSTTVFS